MSERSSAHTGPAGSTFEVDRFELVDGERYEIEGRWSGVRGRVFIRPELTLSDGSQSRRLLADLEQKPWQPAEGDTWAVAFPCAGEAIDAVDAELTVAPDITVEVKRGRRARRAPAGRKPASDKPGGRKPAARGLGVRLAEAQTELEQVRDEHARLSGRLEAAMRRAEETRAELDHASESREQLLAERDGAIRARDDARAERDLAIREAVVDSEVLQRSRDETIAELERTRGELERVLETLQVTAAERDSAIRAGVEVERELHAANTERKALLEQHQQLIARPTQAAVPPQVVPPQAVPPQSFSWSDADDWRHTTHPKLRSRALALAALGTAFVVVLVILVLTVF